MTSTFYSGGEGDALVDADNYPPQIIAYLQQEHGLVRDRVAGYRTMVELGCMEGRGVALAREAGVAYLGVDVVARYIETARRSFGETATRRFELCDAVAIGELAESWIQPAVGWLPFNAFGNMADPVAVVTAAAEAGLELIISTYATDAVSTKARQDYYMACGYHGLLSTTSQQGVRFTSPAGLLTWAYSLDHFQQMLRPRYGAVVVESFATIGVLIRALKPNIGA